MATPRLASLRPGLPSQHHVGPGEMKNEALHLACCFSREARDSPESTKPEFQRGLLKANERAVTAALLPDSLMGVHQIQPHVDGSARSSSANGAPNSLPNTLSTEKSDNGIIETIPGTSRRVVTVQPAPSSQQLQPRGVQYSKKRTALVPGRSPGKSSGGSPGKSSGGLPSRLSTATFSRTPS